MKRFVFDASALVAFFEDLPGAVKVEEVITIAMDGKAQLAMCLVNWSEVCYSLSRAKGPVPTRKILSDFVQLPIQLLAADMELTDMATRLRTEYGLPQASSFAAALAHQQKASLVTVDRFFEKMEKQLKIVWADDQ